MTEDYVVLRIPGLTRGDVLSGDDIFAVAAEEGATAEDVKVETLEALTPKGAIDLKKDPTALGSAPILPIQLIEPVELTAQDIEDGVPADSGDVAWGLAATAVPTSPFTGTGVTVAVLDTGITRNHEAFVGFDNIEEKDFTGEGDGDLNGHGTHCAGTIFGRPVGGVRIGVAPGIEKALIGKVLNASRAGTTAQTIDGMFWAARNGAQIISMSLGFDFPGQVQKKKDKGLAELAAISAVLEAYRENVRLFDQIVGLIKSRSGSVFSKLIVIAAAGNLSKRPDYEIATAPPAVSQGFISVGALRRAAGNKFRVAAFSNSSPKIAGPGVDIRSANKDGGLIAKNGTSMATPHVTGIAALWLESIMADNPDFEISELEARLLASGSKTRIDAAERANAGAGMVSAPPPPQ